MSLENDWGSEDPFEELCGDAGDGKDHSLHPMAVGWTHKDKDERSDLGTAKEVQSA